MKKIFITLAIFLILASGTVKEAYANQPSDFLIRNYSVSVVVDCIDDALTRLNAMPGIVLFSSVDMRSGRGSMERRASVSDADRMLADLHALGQVRNSDSWTQNVFMVVTDLQSELRVREAEYNRLMELLYEVDTMDNFSFVENRLANVISEIEHLRGRLNHLGFETGTVRIGITLWAADPEDEPYEIIGAFARIGNAFMDSAWFTLAAFQFILVILVYISVPLVFVAMVGGCLWFVFRRRRKVAKDGGTLEAEIEESEIESEE